MAAETTDKDKLIMELKAYIDFLSRANEGPIGLAWAHGWRCPEEDIAEGNAFRARLTYLEQLTQLGEVDLGRAVTLIRETLSCYQENFLMEGGGVLIPEDFSTNWNNIEDFLRDYADQK